MVLLIALATVLAVSLLGIAGGVLLIYREKWAKLLSKYLINFAIGAMLGVVFFDLLPEAINLQPTYSILTYSLIGILIFYFLEKTLLWYHHHSVEHIISHKKGRHPPEERAHPAGYLITFGDALHNFIDGLVMAAGFLVDVKLGITTAIAILLHELPQEMGEFAILKHANFSRFKIIAYSLFAQMTAVIGVLLGFFYLPVFEGAKAIMLAVAAGGFIYIAGADLIPETHREKDFIKSLAQIALLLLGVFVMWYVGIVFAE